jgi:hypothetical protein
MREAAPPPCFCVSTGMIGLTGECLGCTGMIGVRGEKQSTVGRKHFATIHELLIFCSSIATEKCRRADIITYYYR